MTLGVDPVKVFSHLNRFLCDRSSVGRYATMFFGLLETDGTLEFVRAGHPSPLLLRRGIVSDLYTSGSFPIGLVEIATFKSARIQLEPGDTLLMFTDGLTEAENKEREFFEEERLKEVFGRQQDLPLSDVQNGILSAVEKFTEGASQSDDVTVVVVRYLGPAPAESRNGSNAERDVTTN
jgi:phosphoserine phosphatase RsbU/P